MLRLRPALRGVTTQSYLFALVAAVIIPVLIFSGYVLARLAANERQRFERDAAQIARQVALVVDGELAGLGALLKGLATSSALADGDMALFHSEAVRLVADRDEIIVLREFGPRQVVNTERPFGAALPAAVEIPPADRAALEKGELIVSDVYPSPISGEPRVAVALSTGGTSPYLLAITVPTSRIHDALIPAVPQDWVVGVGDRDGTYVARSARHEDVTGKPGVPEYLAKATGPSGTFISINFDRVALLAGYHWSEFSGWLYAANIEQNIVEAPLRQSLTLLGAIGAGALALSALLAFRFGTSFTSAATGLAERASALGEGRTVLPMTSRLIEFSLVGQTLERAASAVEERSREREKSIDRDTLLGSIFDAAGISVGIVEILDGDLRFVVANRATASLLGRPDGVESARASALGLGADDARRWLALCLDAAHTTEPVSAEYSLTTEGRSPVWFFGTFTRIAAPGSTAPRIAFTAVDITARRRAEQRLAERTQELETVLATVPAAVTFTYDPDAREVRRNRRAAELMRVSDAETRSFGAPGPVFDHVHVEKDNRPLRPDEMPLPRAMRGEVIMDEEYTFVFSDGTSQTLLTYATGIRDEQGAILGAISVNLDISERKRAEEQRRLLINELNHRVKNTLASVQSIATLTLRDAETLPDARRALTDRLLALSKAHNLLTRENWAGAVLSDIVLEVIEPHAVEGRFRIEGPAVQLPPALSLTLAMVLHELATNALKYGALSTAEGTVSISWQITNAGPGRKLILSWTERNGPAVTPPSRKGFGSRLIERSLAAEANGHAEIMFEPEGVACVIELGL